MTWEEEGLGQWHIILYIKQSKAVAVNANNANAKSMLMPVSQSKQVTSVIGKIELLQNVVF